MRRRRAGALATGLVTAACLALTTAGASAATSVHRVADLNPGGASSYPSGFVGYGGQVYFSAGKAGSGRELWRTDGKTASIVADIAPGTASSDPSELTPFGSALLFTADDGSHGRELWRYDGVNPPSMVADINSLQGSNPAELVDAAGTLFFHAEANPLTGDELWKYDGAGAPVMLAPTPGGIAGVGGSSPSDLHAIGGTVYFWANDGLHATEVWKSNGTDSGTVLVADTNPGFSDPPAFAPLGQQRLPMGSAGGQLLFDANDGVNGIELWRYDGTNPPQMLLGATGGINPDGGGSTATGFTDLNGTVVFSADDGDNGIELWKLDPPYTSPVIVSNINPGLSAYPDKLTRVGGGIFFSAQNGTDGTELWRTDGGSAIEMLAGSGGIRPGFFGSSPNHLTPFGNDVLFEANDGTGFELWQSDGTNTVRVAQINPKGGSYPNALANVGGNVYLAADDGQTGSELWETGPGRKASKCKRKAKAKGKGKGKSSAKHKKKKKHCKKKKKKKKHRRR